MSDSPPIQVTQYQGFYLGDETAIHCVPSERGYSSLGSVIELEFRHPQYTFITKLDVRDIRQKLGLTFRSIRGKGSWEQQKYGRLMLSAQCGYRDSKDERVPVAC